MKKKVSQVLPFRLEKQSRKNLANTTFKSQTPLGKMYHLIPKTINKKSWHAVKERDDIS